MRVILIQDIKSLGKRGDIKNVADGYARNFLLPRKLVRLATSEAVKEVEAWKDKLEKQLQDLKVEIGKVEKETAAAPPTFSVRVGEKGEIFSSVSAAEIKEKLIGLYPQLSNLSLDIEADHIRELGKQEIGISLGRGVEGKITIEVGPQQP